jgi:exodeoxyribonuclease VII small subunit
MATKIKSSKEIIVNDESQTSASALTFEGALSGLEAVIEELEQDNLPLDRALEIFEQGIMLMRKCDTHLKSAQGKIKELLNGENGEIVEKILGTTLESFLNRDEK